MYSCRCIVEGRVQGVGFRYFTQRVARQLGVAGWVRNLPSGEVEIQAEGDANTVREFLDRVRQGPSFSRVTHIDIREVPSESHSSFNIEV